jgi:predicted hydrocarbon binding protein
MHGLIFLQLQKFAQKHVAPQAWDLLLREANLPLQSYSPARAYPDEDFVNLVGAASRVLGKSNAAVVEAFGEFIAPELLRMHKRLLKPDWKTLDVIENAEPLMHAAIRVGNPGAQPPVLDVVRTSADDLRIVYTSERKLCHLAKGILAGIARHFGESIVVNDEACMHNGDPFCALHVTRKAAVPDTAVVVGSETVIVARHADFAPVAQPRFPFLQLPVLSGDLGRLSEYRIVEFLGQGGMGMVFRAIDRRLDRPVALKVLHPQQAAEQSMRQRFLREARAMASVRSDHVVSIYEVGTAADLPYLAMEFLQGESLAAHHQRVGTVPPSQTVQIAREAALGLDALHSRGLVHRDIKPDNLWLEAPVGRVKILDLGLARERGSATVTQTGMVVGTPAYMAPEQAGGGDVDHRADLFSLGCVLYQICTNELPFKGKDILSTLVALATHQPDPPRSIASAVPVELSDLIMDLLQKDPAARPGSSSAVAKLLAQIAYSSGESAPPLQIAGARQAGLCCFRTRWPANASQMSAPDAQ